jgi:XRE family transcriptional regulator, aerobic/anaerobic benzoate catabolism transcriptional regulator
VKSQIFLEELGHRLRNRRKLRGLSQEQLGQIAHVSTRYISQIEAGRGNLSILRLLELTRALGVPVHEVLQPNKWHPIVSLIGLRGSGKSSVGPELAKGMDKPFVELDGLIEDEIGMGLAEIFVLHGEGYYRRLEREVLTRFIANGSAAVLATGGSLVTDRATFDLLKKNTITLWLRALPELHLQRVSAQGDRRPMAGRADPLSDLRALLREREPLYAEADITIDTTCLSTGEVASEAMSRLGEWEQLR